MSKSCPSSTSPFNKKVHLVLGSGGARGLAHIGVIRYLEATGFEISEITGCSMGALIGGIYAANKLDDYQDWVCHINRLEALKFLDLSLSLKSGFVKGDRLMQQLSYWIGDDDIGSLKIPFTAVSADLKSQSEVWINQGPLLEAIRASISVPGIFTPVIKNNRVLVDGGILNPLPIPPKSLEKDQITIAVSLSGRHIKQPMGKTEALKPDYSDSSKNTKPQAQSKLASAWQSLNDMLQTNETADTTTVADKDLSISEVLMSMFNTMQDTLTRYQIAGTPPDILIEIPTNICNSHDFHRANELIPAGEYWAEKAIEEQFHQLQEMTL